MPNNPLQAAISIKKYAAITPNDCTEENNISILLSKFHFISCLAVSSLDS